MFVDNQLSKITDYMGALGENAQFNGVVLAAKQGQILFHAGYGMANAEHTIPNTKDTVFRVGSLSKSMTAGTILRMKEAGLLELHNPITRYVPSYPTGDKITIHQLLTHTAGVPNFTAFPDYWNVVMRLPASIEETVSKFSNLPLDFVPGERFSYSNSGYLLLTYIIEQISGMPFALYMEQNLFEPLGLYKTQIDDGRRLIPNKASGYTVNRQMIHSDFIDMFLPAGAYGVASTAEDLYRWDRALAKGPFLSDESLQQMFTPGLGEYGYGWSIQHDAGGREYICHFGDINGFAADCIRYVAEDLTVIVLSNFNLTPVTKISRDIARLLLGEQVRIPIVNAVIQAKPQLLEKYIGVYKSTSAGTDEPQSIIVTIDEDGLVVEMAKQYAVRYTYRLLPVSEKADAAVFRAELLDEEAHFILDASGHVIEMVYRDLYDNICKCKRVA